jgi:hypothetical protein
MAALLFPKARRLPTEELLAAIGAKLHDLVYSLEYALSVQAVENGFSQSWNQLVQSGQLRDPKLMGFAAVRVAEDRLVDRLVKRAHGAELTFLSTRLLNDADVQISALARNLLIAEQARQNPRRSLYTQLEPVLLRKMAELVAACIQIDSATPCNIQPLLDSYDPASPLSVTAQKLIFAMGHQYREQLIDPVMAGLHLFVSELSHISRLPHDTVIRMIDASSVAPLLALLAACHIPKTQAAAIVEALRGFDRRDGDVGVLWEQYAAMTPELVNDVLAQWRKWESGTDAS